VSDDSLFDIGVYVRMAQRIRHSGGWPGIDLNEVPWADKQITVTGDTQPTLYTGEDKK
jgi:hypothetical protein